MSFYLQLNLSLAVAWAVFQLAPQRRLRYRVRKKLAQVLLFSSLGAVPLLALLPDLSFPKLSAVSAGANAALEEDTAEGGGGPVRAAFRQAAAAAGQAPRGMRARADVWLWILAGGAGVMIARQLRTRAALLMLLRDALTLHAVGRTSLLISDAIAVPFSAHIARRAYVVLPAGLVPYRADLRIALRHEVEHHRRRDTLWAVALEWLVCGFYLNPAVYLWRKTILQLQELACDEALIGRMRVSPRDYGSCLLRVAEMALERRFVCAGTSCMFRNSGSDSHSFLIRRIKMFAHHERSTVTKTAGAVFGTLSVFTVVLLAYAAQAAVRSGSPPNAGHAVYDSRVQPLAEESLRKGMALHGASAGFAIVADPVRGTVIAAVSVNAGFDEKLKGDWALSYPLEPGSAIKPLIVASALQHKVTRIDELHGCEKGEYALGKMLYHDVEPYDKLSTADTVVYSSNICTIKIGQELGARGLENAFREFGMGANGSVKDFPGARPGQIPEAGVIADENYIGLVCHGISNRTDMYVTPLELVQAYGAIANGGRLMKPIGADGKQSPEMIRDVLSSEVSAQMREVLRRVVTEGTARGIKGSAIPLAGKTSTVVTDGNRRITGFIGYAPADQPKIVVYVVLFDPKGSGKHGSNTAAPVFREIVEKVAPIFNP